MKEFSIHGSTIYLLPVIHGLAKEGEKVKNIFYKFHPECIAIGIAPEDIELIDKIKDTENVEMPLQHQYYLIHLSKYGEVSLPPSDILVANEISRKENIPLHAIDIDDETYADMLTENVSIFSLIRHSRKIKKLAQKEFSAKTAEEFVYELYNEINSIKSFKKIEEEREGRMAKAIIKLCGRYKKVLAVVPLEKYEGILKKLESYKKGKSITEA